MLKEFQKISGTPGVLFWRNIRESQGFLVFMLTCHWIWGIPSDFHLKQMKESWEILVFSFARHQRILGTPSVLFLKWFKRISGAPDVWFFKVFERISGAPAVLFCKKFKDLRIPSNVLFFKKIKEFWGPLFVFWVFERTLEDPAALFCKEFKEFRGTLVFFVSQNH